MSEPSQLRLGRILLDSWANGPGRRDVFWTAGCTLSCRGCVNRELLSREAGGDAPIESLLALFEARRSLIDGITLSGGEPLQQSAAIYRLVLGARALDLSVVLFTGYSFVECAEPNRAQVVAACDLVVAGPYQPQCRVHGRPLVASSNQTLHFPTGRYSEADLADVPAWEAIVTEAGAVVTGIATASLGRFPAL